MQIIFQLQCYINDTLIDSDYYEIKPFAAELSFKSSLIDLETFDYSDVSVIIDSGWKRN